MSATDIGVSARSPSRTSAAAWGLALIFGAAAALTLLRPSRLFPGLDTVSQLMIGEAGWWLIAVVVVMALAWDGRGADRPIGLRAPTLGTLLTGVAAGIGLLLLFPAVQYLLQTLGLGLSQPTALDFGATPAWLLAAMALRAGVVEELLFRGYAVTRLEALTGRTWLAALLSLGVFVALHARAWSPGHLIFVAAAGGALTVLYVWRRNLTANIIAHTLVDLAGLLLAKYAAAAA